jgi:hypothetical protein
VKDRRSSFASSLVPSFVSSIRLLAPVIVGVVLPVASSSTALAQTKGPAEGTGTENRAVAEMLFFTARGMMEAGRYSEACTKLAESYRLDPAAGTLLNLAVCHEKEGKVASAWGEFRQAMADARKAGRADREELAKDHVSSVEPELPFLAIEVPAAVRVPGLEIKRNGVAMQQAAWATELPVDPGNVEVVVSAPGYKPRTQTIAIARKQHLSMTIERLELAPVEAPPPVFWTGKRKAGLAIGLVGVAAATVGGITGAMAINKKSESDDACPTFDGELRCSQAGVDAMSQAKTYAVISDVGIVLGAAGIGVGAFLFFTGGAKTEQGSRSASPHEKAHAKAESPWDFRFGAGPTGAHGVLSRSF